LYCFCSQEEIKPYLPDGVKLLKRPDWIDGSKVSGNEIYKAFAETVHSDLYLAVQCTSPFITPESIQKGVDAVLSGEYDSSFSVTEHREFLWQGVKPYLMPNFDPANIIRTQDMNPFYIESCAFWVFNRTHIMEQNKRMGNNPYLVTVSKIEAVDIDYPEDFSIAEAIVKSMSNE
jgi:CMP-N-acetylneuraminic acid synthetase